MNRRILNATPFTYNGIEFKSKTEVMVYKTLIENGFDPKYEEDTFCYWEGRKPTVPFYDLGKDKHLYLNMKKLVGAHYTPDFTFWCGKTKVIIEVKGYANDIYPLKRKLFRAYLETLSYPVIFAEIHTKRQLLEFIHELKKIIKDNETQ